MPLFSHPQRAARFGIRAGVSLVPLGCATLASADYYWPSRHETCEKPKTTGTIGVEPLPGIATITAVSVGSPASGAGLRYVTRWTLQIQPGVPLTDPL